MAGIRRGGQSTSVEIDLFQAGRKGYNLRLTLRDGELVTIEDGGASWTKIVEASFNTRLAQV